MSIRNQAGPAKARQEKAREQARQDILIAAARVFAQRGYAASTLAELAQAAGFAAPSLYRYFESKEEIFRSLVELVKAEVQATFDAPVAPGQPLQDRLRALLTLQIEMAVDRREIVALLLSTPPASLGGQHPVAEYRAGASLYERSMVAWMERHVAQAELRCPLFQAARALAAIAHAFHHTFIVSPPAAGIEPAMEAGRIVDLALHGIATTQAR